MALATLLLIDDSASQRSETIAALAGARLFGRVLEASDGAEGLKLLLGEDVDLVVCDLEMPGFDGEKLLHIKCASPRTRAIPFVMLTACSDRGRRARLLELGAHDLVDKPAHAAELCARLKLHLRTKRLQDELLQKNELMARLSTTDPVTGLRTRRFVCEALSIEYLRARRYKTPLAIAMADLDHFKRVNDEHGHLAGDVVLQGVAGLLLQQLRATDCAGRYGGEEILLVTSQSDARAASVLAERWRAQVEAAVFDSGRGAQVRVRLSLGVAQLDEAMRTPDDLIARADEALYRAKAEGRNRLVVAD
jgi:two-component system cell cycle response regulator